MKRFAIAALFLLATAPAWAATYWVSPSGVAGRSGADSTTNATTLAWVNTHATSGDVVRFKQGTYTDPIYPRNLNNTTSRIRFYGFPQDPGAVKVAYIRFGTLNGSGGQDGNYVTARWITSLAGFDVVGSTVPVRAVHGDSLVKCVILAGGVHMNYAYALLADSCTFTLTYSGSGINPAIEFLGHGAGLFNGTAGTWDIGAVNDTIKHSTFNCTYLGTGDTWVVIAHGGTAYNEISDCTFNVTYGRNGGYYFFCEQYETYYLSLLRNTINWTNTVVNTGNHGIFTQRDSSSYGHFGYNTVTISGVGYGDGLLSNSGTWAGTTGHNRIDHNLFVTSLGKAASSNYVGLLSFQNGTRADTIEFNTIASFGSLPCLGINSASSADNAVDGLVVRHNTFISGSPKVVDFGGTNPISNSPRFVGNIYYSTAANTSGSELLRVASGIKLDSAGTFFARGGDPTKAISYAGSDGTPGSGGNYGASGKANWGTPLFTDSSFATLNTTLRTGSYAVNASLSDGYSGASGVAITPTLSPDLRIDLRHTVDGGVSTSNTFRLIISNVGSASSFGATGTMALGTGLTFGAFFNDNQNGNFAITSTTFDAGPFGIGAGDSAWVEFTVTPGAGSVPSASSTVTLDASSQGYNASFTSDTDVLPVATPSAPNLRIDLRHVADGYVGLPDTLMLIVKNIGSATAAFSTGGNAPLTVTIGGSGYSNTFMTRNIDGIADAGHAGGTQCSATSFGFPDDLAAGDSCWIKWTVTPKVAGIGSQTITALIDSVSNSGSCGGDGSSTTAYGRGTAANSYDADILPITGPSPNNAVTAVGVLKEANLYSIGVRVFLAGDADSNAVCRLFYRPYGSSANYDSGMTMVRRTGATAHVGRLLWLSPGVTYQFYVEVTDTDGGSQSTTADTATTRTPESFSVTNPGGAIYVSKSGNDNSFGNSPETAVLTLSRARDLLRALPNEGIGSGIYLVGPGEWHERIDLQFGSPTTNRGYFISGYGAPADTIILDGSYEPAAVNGYVDATHAISWSSTGVDSIYKCYYPHGDSCATVTLGFGETLHKKTTMTELIQDTGAGVSGNVVGERSGWFWQNDTLYVQRATGESPSGLALHAGYIDKMINIQVNRVRISGLTIRYAGGAQGNGMGIILGTGVKGHGDACQFDSLKCYGLSDAGILCSGGGKSPDSCIVTNCTFSGMSVSRFPYEMTKNRSEEAVTSMVVLGKSWSINHNTIMQMANGMTTGGLGQTDTTSGSDCEVLYNTILNTSDDPVECDLSHHINSVVAYNTISRTVAGQQSANSGISYTPIWTGPGWCLYNRFTNYKLGGFKIGGVLSNGGNGTGYVLFAHNTVATTGGNFWAVLSRGHFENMHWVDNIMVGSGSGAGTYLIQHGNNNSTNNDTTGEYRNDFNFNLEDTVSAQSRMFNWHDTKVYSLKVGTGWISSTSPTPLPWDANSVVGRASFVDSTFAVQNYALASNSAAINIGRRIPGINTPFYGTSRYYGSAPDAGFSEYNPTVASGTTTTRGGNGQPMIRHRTRVRR